MGSPHRQQRYRAVTTSKRHPNDCQSCEWSRCIYHRRRQRSSNRLGYGLLYKQKRRDHNHHVIQNGDRAVAEFPDGRAVNIDGVLASHKARDVAIIKAHGDNFQTLTLGDSDRLEVGDEVVAIGSPHGLESTVSNGIISAIRTVEEKGKLLQITAPISHGSSGGPLFNMAGQVVGITSSGIEEGENLNFAIPINDAKRLLLGPQRLVSLPNEPIRKEP